MITTSPAPSTSTTELVSRVLSVLRGVFAAAPARQRRRASAEHTLLKSRTVALPASRGLRIDCLEGCLWITQDGDPRDVVVQSGQSFTVDRDQRALVYAMEAARVRVSRSARS
jgi:hypothetical protein